MTDKMQQSLVAFKNCHSNEIVGCGILIGPTQVITCCHVVNLALNRDRKGPQPTEAIRITFPFIGDEPIDGVVTVWDNRDVACLEISDSPAESVPAVLRGNVSIDSLRFSAVGYPKGYTGCTFVKGTVDHQRDDRLFQMHSDNATGKQIEEGFSGGPVWSEDFQDLFGMIVKADLDRPAKVGFMISSEDIIKILSQSNVRYSVDAIQLPIVVVAMTSDELKNMNGQGGNSQMDDIIRNTAYGDLREDWHPMFSNNQSIRTIIEEIIGGVNLDRQARSMEPLDPNFESSSFFSKDDNEKRQIWKKLRDTGGLVVVDVVSLLNPKIQEDFQDSNACIYNNISVLGVFPLPSDIGQTFQDSQSQIVSNKWEVQERIDKHKREFTLTLNHSHFIKDWLSDVIPSTASRISVLRPNVRRTQRIRDEQQGRGIDKQIFGGRNQ